MSAIHQQLKHRRKALGLKQEDMELRVGMARQQYQRLESKGNPRLETLELVAKGLQMELMLIPQEKQREVRDLLEGRSSKPLGDTVSAAGAATKKSLSDDPWQELLEDEQ